MSRLIKRVRTIGRLCAILPGLLLLAAPQAAVAQDPDPAPILRLNGDQHQAVIHDVAISPDGGVIATTGDDKTIRLWDAGTGESIETLRIPIGAGQEGILYALAFSPSGKALLAGGISGVEWAGQPSLYLMRPLTGQIAGRLGLAGVLRRIVYDTSGEAVRFALAVSYSGGGSVQVRDARGQVLFEDDRYQGAPVWVDFAPDGSLVAVEDGGTLRVYGPDYAMRTVRLPGSEPAIARVSPDGSTIAVGYFDRRSVDLYDFSDLSEQGQLAGQVFGGEPHLNAITWRGSELWAGGALTDSDGRIILRRWQDPAQPGRYQDLAVAEDTITRLETTPDGDVIFAASDPAWGRIGSDFQIEYSHRRPGPDFRLVYDDLFSVSPDGRQVAFRFDRTGDVGEFLYDTGTGTLRKFQNARSARQETKRFREPEIPDGLADWRIKLRPSFRGQRLTLSDSERSLAAASLSDGGFVIGGDRGLHVFDASGGKIARRDMSVAAFGVIGLPDGRFIAAHGDGTLRWYRVTDAREIEETGAFYLARPDRPLTRSDEPSRLRWLAWLPDGRFTHSDNGGQELAGYHVNRGAAEPADWIEFRQLYSQFYAPDDVNTRLTGVLRFPIPVPRPVPGATSQPSEPVAPNPPAEPVLADASATVTSAPAPRIELIEFCPFVGNAPGPCSDADLARRGLGLIADDAADETTFEGGIRTLPAEASRVLVRFRLIDGGIGIEKVDIFNNDRTTGRTRGLGQIADAPSASDAATTAETEEPGFVMAREVLLLPGQNEIQVRAYDPRGIFGVSTKLALLRREPDQTELPDLHALIVGANSYDGPFEELRLARPDAETVEKLLRDYRPETYKDLTVTTLHDDEVTRESVIAALGELADRATPDDAVVVYFAGHGARDDSGAYHFIAPDLTAMDQFGTHTVDQETLIDAIGDLQVQNLMLMLDTCYAGGFPSAATGRISNETGFVVLSASASVAEALDGYDDDHGVFAFALREALEGEAAIRGIASAQSVAEYIVDRVPELAAEKSYEQVPKRMTGNIEQKFPISQIKRDG